MEKEHRLHADREVTQEHPLGRSGPGLAPYLDQTELITTKKFSKMVNHESGLLGVLEICSNMRDLLARETDDVRAAKAAMPFCCRVKKWMVHSPLPSSDWIR